MVSLQLCSLTHVLVLLERLVVDNMSFGNFKSFNRDLQCRHVGFKSKVMLSVTTTIYHLQS